MLGDEGWRLLVSAGVKEGGGDEVGKAPLVTESTPALSAQPWVHVGTVEVKLLASFP
jgi:hypothetical protein